MISLAGELLLWIARANLRPKRGFLRIVGRSLSTSALFAFLLVAHRHALRSLLSLPGPAADQRSRMAAEASAPRSQEALHFKEGSEAQERSEWMKAIKAFSKAVELNGNNANYLYHLGATPSLALC